MTPDPTANRRQLASRKLAVVHWLVGQLLRTSVTPNLISAAGIGFAGLAALALAGATEMPWLWLAGAAFIQLRLLANLLDGLVAVEAGRGSATGPLWNEVPDRVEDVLIFASFGIAAGAPALGVWAALAAVACAYVRLMGGSLGQPQSFMGPMAKQHRMAALTAGCVLGLGVAIAGTAPSLPALVLWAVLAGTLVTIARRLMRIAALLKERG